MLHTPTPTPQTPSLSEGSRSNAPSLLLQAHAVLAEAREVTRIRISRPEFSQSGAMLALQATNTRLSHEVGLLHRQLAAAHADAAHARTENIELRADNFRLRAEAARLDERTQIFPDAFWNVLRDFPR